MRRVQLVEFEDAAWLPRAIRDGATDLLDLGFDRLGFYDGVAGELATVPDATGAPARGGTRRGARPLRSVPQRIGHGPSARPR